MRKSIFVLLICTLSVIATACGDGANKNKTSGDESGTGSQDTTVPNEHERNSGAEHETQERGHDAGEEHETQEHGHDAGEEHETQERGHDAGEEHETQEHGHDSVAGRPGDKANINRTIEVTLDDTMRFTPDQISVAQGETVRFVLKNNGKIPHEFVIGSMAELIEHAEMMRSMPTMKHAESNMVTLAAGEQGEVIWQFDKAGTVDFACLIPGHLEAGMKGSIKVE